MSRHAYDVACALKKVLQQEPEIIALDNEGRHDEMALAFAKLTRLRGILPSTVFSHYYVSLWRFYVLGLQCCLRNHMSVILANSWTIPGIAAFLLHKTFGIPYIIFSHGLELHNPQKSGKVRWLMRRVLADAARVIVISSYTRQLVQENVCDATIRCLAPIVDMARFLGDTPLPDQRLINKRVLLTVGRLVEHKGQDIVIQALPRILRKFPDVVYCIVGGGPYEGMLRQIASENGVAENVIFAGEVPEGDLAAYYKSCELFLGMSRYIEKTGEVEGFGIVFLEAAACAKPVIAGDSGGIRDAVVDKETGLLVPSENPDAVAQAIEKLLSDKALALQMGARGKKRVEEEFTIAVFQDGLMRIIYESIC